MGSCCCKKRANIASGRTETVVLAVEMRNCWARCKCHARKVRKAAAKCRGVDHAVFHRCTGLLTVVGTRLDPAEIQYWVEKKTCGKVSVISYSKGSGQEGPKRGGGGNGGRGQPGVLWDGPVGHPRWAVPPLCVPPCAVPNCAYYYYPSCPCI